MRPTKIEMTNFACHRQRTVSLSSGLTLVTGPNGAGKSTGVVESVVWCVWGRTVRGNSPRPPAAAANLWTSVQVELEHKGVTFVVSRSTNGKRTVFSWSRGGEAAVEYETNTKAQAALEAEIGTHDLWVATSLFTADDAAMFTTATDSQRKKLLEQLLGLEALDAAHVDVRGKFSQLQKRMALLQTKYSGVDGKISGLESSLQRFEEMANIAPPAPEDPAPLKQELAEVQAAMQASRTQLSKAQLDADQAKRGIVRVLNGKCLACNQAVPVDLLAAQHAEATRAAAAHARAVEELGAIDEALSVRAKELSNRLQNIQAQLSQRKALETYTTQYDAALDEIGELFVTRAQLQSEFVALRTDLDVHEHAVSVLGPKGVRAQILQRALSSLSELANTYLTWLSPGIRVHILPYTTTSTGATTDAYQLLVEGAGGHKYEGASGGEKRRIDIALVLALAQLRRSDMLIADDLFDALDRDGVDAVCELLVHVASKGRAVVLLTHTQNTDLIESVRPRAQGHIAFP
jgi:DNA repair exonuclease SbcCD ATPase subunit